MSFRHDINFLRSIAVLLVVIFHFNADWISAGFVGVDVFFVLSGFLMTSIVTSQLERGSFNYLTFCHARVVRIVPALGILSLCVCGFLYTTLSPADLKIFSKHLLSTASFLSNFIYWSESGYFDASEDSKWLLHSWSLSVEWQFYMIYPLILIAAAKYKLSFVKLILLVTGASLALSIVISQSNPDFSYFLLPTRAWEMTLGGGVYLLTRNTQQTHQQLLSVLGTALIIWSAFYYSSKTNWPGYAALVPTAGACLVLLGNHQQNPVFNLRFFQLTGLWSYSIYLWHWPIVLALKHFNLDGPFLIIGMGVSILAGGVSYHLVEKIPFKKLGTLGNSIPYCFPVLIVLVGSYISLSKGAPNRFGDDITKLYNSAQSSPYRDQCHTLDEDNDKTCTYGTGDPTWAVFGDSHLVEITYALSQQLEEKNIAINHFTYSSCLPLLNPEFTKNPCSSWYPNTFNSILNSSKIETVVIGHRWFEEKDFDVPFDQVFSDFSTVINNLARSKKKVYVINPIPQLNIRIQALISSELKAGKKELNQADGESLKSYYSRNEKYFNFMKTQTFPSNVIIIRPTDLLCGSHNCHAVMDSKALYFDDNHLSTKGAELVSKKIVSTL